MKITIQLFILWCITQTSLFCQSGEPIVVRSYEVPEARQGVATDSLHFFVINNSSISKHLKSSGQMVGSWVDRDSVLVHMNSGCMIDGKLYVVNSNYPESPMASSIEIFDPESLEHIDNHSLGILHGSATWMDEYQGFLYVVFAHYTGRGSEPGKDNSWTRLVKLDRNWQQIESWIFPDPLLDRFVSRSNSGGVILPDGRILCTGHDNFELYELRFPSKGYTLEWKRTLSVGSYGQGIAHEYHGDRELIFGIIKKNNQVVVSKIK